MENESLKNLYEHLSLPQNATAEAIEAAIDARYNQWRKLVNHHDPAERRRAEAQMDALEKMRTILLDPDKRAVYDQSLIIGGLADPQASPRHAPAPVGTPPADAQRETRAPASSAERVDAWLCPGCATPHPIGTKHCSKCGAEVGEQCPECRQMIAAGSVFCLHCGVNVDEAISARFRRKQENRIREARSRLETVDGQIEIARKAKRKLLYTWFNTPPYLSGGGSCLINLLVFVVIGALAFFGSWYLLRGFLDGLLVLAVWAVTPIFILIISQLTLRWIVHRRANREIAKLESSKVPLQQELARIQAEPLPARAEAASG